MSCLPPYNCMPVNIDRYEGTVLDADGNVVADAMKGSDLARMVSNVATGTYKSRESRVWSPRLTSHVSLGHVQRRWHDYYFTHY